MLTRSFQSMSEHFNYQWCLLKTSTIITHIELGISIYPLLGMLHFLWTYVVRYFEDSCAITLPRTENSKLPFYLNQKLFDRQASLETLIQPANQAIPLKPLLNYNNCYILVYMKGCVNVVIMFVYPKITHFTCASP